MSPQQFRAQDKLALLLALVPYLLDQRRVSVADAAAHFAVEPDLIREAVSLIAVSGVPGETKQYQHGDLFDIDWDAYLDRDTIVVTHQVAIDDTPRFSAREAAALIAGLQYLAALPEHDNREAIATLMAKLTRGASAAPSQLAVAETASAAEASAEEIGTLRAAISGETQVEFEYLNARGQRESRVVDPLRIESIDQDWYLRGWCHLRHAVRTFRLDRITGLRGTERPITRHGDDVVVPSTLFDVSADDLRVQLELPSAALPLLADYVTPGARTTRTDDKVRLTIRVPHYHGLKRLVSGLPGLITVLGPPEARQIVADWAAAGAAQYAESDA
ncbi:helix-turn-helix transcriptional regulator [Microterricola viridarii]|uniref:DNA-binding transcriptional regulator n=1 Tax=Microterricola viridarii TaxID=412690 RepID=A0A109QWQ1_9MICO|nr:WYL domain-containing protein [Microterricola viridarii]AMB58505.1 DNA-binding transcriptional regulator [Microterricola viridarii]